MALIETIWLTVETASLAALLTPACGEAQMEKVSAAQWENQGDCERKLGGMSWWLPPSYRGGEKADSGTFWGACMWYERRGSCGF